MISNTAAATYLYSATAYVPAELYVLTGAAGSLSVTTWPAALLSASPAVIERGNFKLALGDEIPTLDLTIAEGGLTFGGLSLCKAGLAGYFDDVKVVAKRVLDPGGDNIAVERWTGWVQQVEPQAGALRLVVKGLTAQLGEPFLRPLQPNCPYKFKSTACGYSGGTSTCDKTFSTCTSLSNAVNFGAFPLIPPPDDDAI